MYETEKDMIKMFKYTGIKDPLETYKSYENLIQEGLLKMKENIIEASKNTPDPKKIYEEFAISLKSQVTLTKHMLLKTGVLGGHDSTLETLHELIGLLEKITGLLCSSILNLDETKKIIYS